MSTSWLDDIWNTEEYQQLKKENFKIVSDYLETPPTKILDIGCGMAWESRMFNQKYGSELWLLDGDVEDNDPSSVQQNYHENKETFSFYHPLTLLDQKLKEIGTKDYHLIDSNKITLDQNIKFDLITSWLSCGFHYPANSYKDLILNHSHATTRIIFDLRMIKRKTGIPVLPEDMEVVAILNRRSKYITAEVRFK